MGWHYGPESPKRDPAISWHDEANDLLAKPELIPWRYKFVRLWRFLTCR